MATVSVSGMDEAVAHLRAIRRQIEDPNSAMYKDIGKIVEQSIETNFDSEGRPSWAPRVDTLTHPILDLSGTMKDDALLTARQPWKSSGSTRYLDIMTQFYGFFHQYGTTRLPIRKFVQFLANEIEDMRNRIREIFTA